MQLWTSIWVVAITMSILMPKFGPWMASSLPRASSSSSMCLGQRAAMVSPRIYYTIITDMDALRWGCRFLSHPSRATDLSTLSLCLQLRSVFFVQHSRLPGAV